MQNLNQIRALHALKDAQDTVFAGKDGGQVVKKVPAMIMEAGLLGALAFAIEKGDKADGYSKVLMYTMKHCQDCGSDIVDFSHDCEDLKGILEDICGMESTELRALTSEAMAYLSFLRRFAQKAEG